MNQDNWKTWLVIFVLSVGVAFEMIKRVPQSEGNLWERDGAVTADVQPYSIRHLNPSAPHVQKRAEPMHVAAEAVMRNELKKFVADNAQHATSPKAPKKKTAKKKKKVAGPDDEIFVDPATGKKYRRKKKKEDKTEVAKTDTTQPQTKPNDKKATENIDNNLNAALFAGGVTDDSAFNNYTTGNGGVTNNNVVSLEEWETRLLTKPDADETKQFIKLYNQDQVSSSIFYQIVQKMLADKRTDMRKLGILCAGSTPSVTSFQLLATAESTESDSGVKSYEDGFLNLYSDLGNLPILQKVLSSNAQAAVTTQALQRLQTAATRYLSGGGTTTPPPTGQPSAQSAARNATYFQRFVSILQNLSKSSNSTIVAEAQQTLTSLQTLLAAAGSTTVAAKRRS